jgi:hypothetical protein
MGTRGAGGRIWRRAVVAALALLAAGCETATDIAYKPDQLAVAGIDGDASAPVQAGELANADAEALERYASALDVAYRKEAGRIETASAALFVGYAAAAATTAAALLYDAHVNVLKGAGLAAGGLLVADQYLEPDRRAQVFRGTAEEMRCIVAAADTHPFEDIEPADVVSALRRFAKGSDGGGQALLSLSTDLEQLDAGDLSQTLAAAAHAYMKPPQGTQAADFSAQVEALAARNLAQAGQRRDLLYNAIVAAVARADRNMKRELPDYGQLVQQLTQAAQRAQETGARSATVQGGSGDAGDVKAQGQNGARPTQAGLSHLVAHVQRHGRVASTRESFKSALAACPVSSGGAS